MIPLLNDQWSFGFAQFSHGDGPDKKMIFSHNLVHYVHLPGLVKKVEELEALGFVLNAKYLSIGRDEQFVDGELKETTYSINTVVMFSYGSDALTVNVYSTSYRDYETACANSQTQHLHLRYCGEPVEGGKGQLKACRQIAKEIYQRHGNWLGGNGRIVVPYRTRGGRGGWIPKVAERAFKPEDLGIKPVTVN